MANGKRKIAKLTPEAKRLVGPRELATIHPSLLVVKEHTLKI